MSIDCILNRRSVRSFTSEPVGEEDLSRLLKAGLYAPSAVNKQPWAFVVVRDVQRKKDIASICPYWHAAEAAPLVIVVSADLRNHDEVSDAFFVQDCSAASENILCAAAGMELGGVWLGTYGVPERVEAVQRLLSMPEGVVPVSVLAIGHPEKQPAPHSFFDETKIHYEAY